MVLLLDDVLVFIFIVADDANDVGDADIAVHDTDVIYCGCRCYCCCY